VIKIFKILLFPFLLYQNPLAAEKPSSMFPPDIALHHYYGDWYGPELEQLGEKPLWVDNKETHEKEVIRFLFIPGVGRTKGRHSTVIRIEIEQEVARLIARTEFRDPKRDKVQTLTDKSLSRAQIAKMRELISKAGLWEFRVEQWGKDPEAYYTHCTELVMERRIESKYAVSHILVSCDQPSQLMPLVNYVANLAGQSQKVLRYSYSAE
jgi:hypothetical protein